MSWIIIITGLARTIFWSTGFVIAAFFPSLLRDVPYRRMLAVIAFAIAAMNAAFFTISAADGHPSQTAINLTSASGVFTSSLFLTIVVLSAYGPRKSPH